jgi:hypothetical protein
VRRIDPDFEVLLYGVEAQFRCIQLQGLPEFGKKFLEPCREINRSWRVESRRESCRTFSTIVLTRVPFS